MLFVPPSMPFAEAQQTGDINISWTSLTITSSAGGTTFSPGDTAHIEATLAHEGDPPMYLFDNNAEFRFPDSSEYNDVGKGFGDVSISTGGTVTLTWDKVIPTDLNPAGQYTVTFFADEDGMFDETNESDNVITGTFTVAAPADTTPPVVNVPADMTVTTTNSSGEVVTFGVTASDDVGLSIGAGCDIPTGSTFPVGTTTVTCTAHDTSGNVGTASFTITVNYTPSADTTPPTVNVPADITVVSTDGEAVAVTTNVIS